MSFDERAYLKSVIKAHSQTSVSGKCQWCGTPNPCAVYTEASESLQREYRREYERQLLIGFLQEYDPDAANSELAVDDFLSERYND